jgi:hypothetical protein
MSALTDPIYLTLYEFLDVDIDVGPPSMRRICSTHGVFSYINCLSKFSCRTANSHETKGTPVLHNEATKLLFPTKRRRFI